MKTKMTKLLSILLCCLMFVGILPTVAFAETVVVSYKINETNFPDANFRAFVKKFDTNNDDWLWVSSEIAEVTEINCRECNISDLKGIELFTNLKLLSCSMNQLTTLDLSKNTALEELYCWENKLTSLNVSKNTKLTELDCSENELTTLDVSKNTELENLYPWGNKLTSLDVSKNTKLVELECAYNELTALDASKNTALTDLLCYDNDLTALNVSGCAALKRLECYNNKLTTLDVSVCTALEELRCGNNKLETLDVSKNTALETLECYSNNLTALNISGCTELNDIIAYENKLTAVDVSKNTKLGWVDFDDNNLTSLDLSNNTALVTLYCDGNVYSITAETDRTFDLSKLPGSFDVTKASEWNGGTVSGNILTVNPGAGKVTYSYDCGQGRTKTFTLDVKIPCLKTPSTTTINYGDSIILHAETANIPAGGYVVWTADNDKFGMSVSEDGSTCKISPKSSGKTVITLTVYDKDGNPVSSDTQEMTAKAGIWQKIVAFFKSIFGLTKTFPEAYKNVF